MISAPATGVPSGPLARCRVSSYDSLVEILRSAARHGVEAEDILHALENAVVVEEIDEDPTKYLVLGPDRSARFLELVVLDRPQGPAVIHAMPMRTQYLKYLNRRR